MSLARRHCLTGVLALLLLATSMWSTPAQAWPHKSQVTMKGHLDCGLLKNAKKMTWRTDHGESGRASLSTSRLGRWTDVVGRPARLIKIQEYTVRLRNVPSTGTTLHYTVTCELMYEKTLSEHSGSYGVNRPATGTTGTRHICATWQLLGCIV